MHRWGQDAERDDGSCSLIQRTSGESDIVAGGGQVDPPRPPGPNMLDPARSGAYQRASMSGLTSPMKRSNVSTS